MKEKTGKKDLAKLRKRAQSILATASQKRSFSQADVTELIQELDTYQIELELQNEDLRTSQVKLEKYRHRYADLYDYAPAAYITISNEGLIIEANLKAGDMLGIPRGELFNRPFSDFVVPASMDEYYISRQKLLETGRSQSLELMLRRQDGSSFHTQMDTVIHSEDRYSPGQMHAIFHDISARKEVELAKLRKLKDKYWTILMDQNDLIWRLDADGRTTFVNDAFCRYFGVDHTHILGTVFLPKIHEDDLDKVKKYRAALTPLEPEKTIEYQVYLPDGKMRWLQWLSRALYNQDGSVAEYQRVGRDITPRKNLEQQLQGEIKLRQLFLDALPGLAFLSQHENQEIVVANKAAIEAGVVPGKLCFAAWAKRETPCPWCGVPKARQKRETVNEQFWANGQYWDAYWAQVTDSLCFSYIIDITDKKRTEEALEESYRELEVRVAERTLELQNSHKQLLHAEKLTAVGSLSASIAHEFNSPLQSVMTILDGIIKYAALKEDEQELADVAFLECQRMKNLIANLRDFYQPTSGHVGQVDVHMLLDSILLLTRKEFQSQGIQIVKEYSEVPCSVRAVADQLKQVFLNLLNNAACACGNGDIVTVSTERTAPENIAVHIRDTGAGIEPSHIKHLFEPFFTTKPEVKGTGLGLSVSYGIIKQHGGHIEVKSKPGEGATFSVFLPIEGV
ncbi:PAS domain-containing sensor histidine kinase [Desulfopila sp. IMCC35008]|uniref:PAS domain-containing sensor histidine kinase n=1 Tax=Desulfopila sp. IMCC35008 TaxID=2653858 RepID=UPI0013D5885C|nr:PAS domain-containing sensor histidine kinase [Desulfopila sp. IMCC35008]